MSADGARTAQVRHAPSEPDLQVYTHALVQSEPDGIWNVLEVLCCSRTSLLLVGIVALFACARASLAQVSQYNITSPLRICTASIQDFGARCNGAPTPEFEDPTEPEGPVPAMGWCTPGQDFCGYDVDVWRYVIYSRMPFDTALAVGHAGVELRSVLSFLNDHPGSDRGTSAPPIRSSVDSTFALQPNCGTNGTSGVARLRACLLRRRRLLVHDRGFGRGKRDSRWMRHRRLINNSQHRA